MTDMTETTLGWMKIFSPRRTIAPASFFARLDRRLAALRLQGEPASFAVHFPDGSSRVFGGGAPVFSVAARDDAGARALASFDDLSIAEAYMNGHLDLCGDMFAILRHRGLLSDQRPLQYLWETYLQAAVFGQVAADRSTIPAHYDLPADFFTLWLDDGIRGYSHAFFENDDERLEVAMERKFQYAFDACRLRPGQRVLDIGGGWGSFVEFAGKRGVRVTSVTISKESARFMRELIRREALPCEVVEEHFFDFRSRERFDAIMNLGVTEHLPDYRRTLAQYQRLLAPGARVYLDSYTGGRFNMSSFVTKWVYEGNTSPLCLASYLAELERSDLEVVRLLDDTHNYHLTCRKWAERLDAAHAAIATQWGEFLYRRFRLYLWGCARAFADRVLTAHRMVLELHPGTRARRRLFQF